MLLVDIDTERPIYTITYGVVINTSNRCLINPYDHYWLVLTEGTPYTYY